MDSAYVEADGIIGRYSAIGRQAASLPVVQAVIARYNLPWLIEAPKGNDYPLPPHRETVSSGSAFGRYLKGAYQVPFLHRLAFLKQLSTVVLSTHLEATHTRLSHSIGTAKVAARLLNVILENGFGATEQLDDLSHDACLFYCLIHDAFHGPMGHSLDLMKDVFGDSLEEKLDNALLRRALDGIVAGDPDRTGAQILLAAETCRPGEGNELVEKVRLLADPYRLRREAPQLFFLRDIVNSDLDADRIDYLMRDSRALEGSEHPELLSLTESARAVDIDEGKGSLTRLAYARKEARAVGSALGLRRRLYTLFYEAADKLIVDDMICHAVFYVLRDLGLLDRRATDEEATRQAILRDILLLTDDDFFAALGELRAPSACYELLVRVRQHNYFQHLFKEGVELHLVDDTVVRHNSWMKAVSDLTRRLTQERGKQRYPEACKPEDLGYLQEASKPYLSDTGLLVFSFQEWTRGSFRARKGFEDRVWAKFCEGDQKEELRRTFVTKEYGSVDVYDAERLTHYPPIHVTTSSFFQVLGRADLARHPKEGGQPENGILLYVEGANGSLAARREEISTEIEEKHEAFPVVVSAPVALVSTAGPSVLTAFFDELRSCHWLWGALRSGLVPGPQASGV